MPGHDSIDATAQSKELLAAFRWVPLLVSVPMLIALAIFRPTSPDLIAQMSRATAPGVTWWTTWYGGITTPSYSVITPALMWLLGVWGVGILSVLVICWCANELLIGQHRPRLAAMLIAIGAVGNLASGRVTFGVGVALGMVALVGMKRKNTVIATIAGALSTLASPLAGLFLAIFAAAITRQQSYRRIAIWTCVAAMLGLGMVAIFFPTKGVMPMRWGDVALGVGSCAVIALSTRSRVIRDIAILLGVITLVCFVTQTAVGKNIIRLPMVFGMGIFVINTRVRRIWFAIWLASFVAFFAVNTLTDLKTSSGRAARDNYYQPLLAQLPEKGEAFQRIEVLDPESHGPALYVAKQVPVARGWERQADMFRNPLFYEPGLLNAESYREWLHSLAVRWVAVPHTKLDYASRDEATLIKSGLPYLKETWRNDDWKLYEVADSTPLVEPPLQVVRWDADRLVLRADRPGDALVRVAWTPGLSISNLPSEETKQSAQARVLDGVNNVPGCARQDRPDGFWTMIHVDTPGEFQLHYSGPVRIGFDPGVCRVSKQ